MSWNGTPKLSKSHAPLEHHELLDSYGQWQVQPGVVYTTFHFPMTGANIVTTENSDWATNCPEYKVTAVQATRVTQPSEWQKQQVVFNRQQKNFLDKARDLDA